MSARQLPAPLIAGLAAALLASCAAPTTPDDKESTAAAPGFPREVSSCGVETKLQGPPQRIVTIKSSATEMVLALGAGDELVGTAFSDGPLPPDLTNSAEDVPELADENPSHEAVLELEPDLVYAGWESNLSADGAGKRERFEELDISTFVSPAACQGADQPRKLSFDDVFDEIEQVGEILGRSEAAEELIASQRQRLEAVEPSGEGRSALWYSSGSEVPFIGGGRGAPQMLMSQVGLDNIAADVDDTWDSLSWEVVAERDPEVIVLVDSAWNTAEHKMEILADNPVTAELDAVRQERYLTVPFPATEAGVRNVPAAHDLAEQLTELQADT